MQTIFVTRGNFYKMSCILAILILLSSFSFYLLLRGYDKSFEKRIDELSERVSEPTALAAAAISGGGGFLDRSGLVKPVYVVTEYQGKIGVFSADKKELLKVLDIEFSSLPAADRRYLEEGIIIFTPGQLMSVITDYTS